MRVASLFGRKDGVDGLERAEEVVDGFKKQLALFPCPVRCMIRCLDAIQFFEYTLMQTGNHSSSYEYKKEKNTLDDYFFHIFLIVIIINLFHTVSSLYEYSCIIES